MKTLTLLLLRVSLGLLMLIWGLDKLVNVEHGLNVSDGFYFGLFSSPRVLNVFGVLQVALGVLIVLGLLRRFSYPALLAVTATTLIGVWRSIIDPWGWYLEGTSILFFPSLIILAAVFALMAFRTEDRYALDARRGQPPSDH